MTEGNMTLQHSMTEGNMTLQHSMETALLGAMASWVLGGRPCSEDITFALEGP